MRKFIIGVMGAGEGARDENVKAAYRLGSLIAREGWVLLTGGRNVGVMDAANRGAKEAGGLTVGVLPGSDRGSLSEAVDVPILTGMGNARNVINVLSSDVVIACGHEGAGTASEIALALKAKKPVVLLNGSEEGARFFKKLGGERVKLARSPEEAVQIAKTILGSTKVPT